MKYLTLVAALLSAQCALSPSGRYTTAADPASRYDFQYVRDRTTGRWVHREFEIRVDMERTLPDFSEPSPTGNRVSVQLFKPGSAQSGGIFSAIPVVEGGYRIWRGADVLHKEDLGDRIAYGVSVSWPRDGQETKYDPMEIFPLPALGDTVPEQWTRWATAASLRAGAMAWWDQTVGNPSAPVDAPAHPFEFRWRLVFAEIPGRIP